ncbi:MAG: NADH-quinone oxidoreductase subunit M [Methanonatronarchaeales archaeon]|nr:NADH-quinone oxidoreductase subunit M [Methanonatronarchaeales archaeon]
MIGILTILLAIPLVTGTVILLMDEEWTRAIKLTALGSTVTSLALTAYMLAVFEVGGGVQFREYVPWIETLGVSYHLGVDGLSMSMILLTQLFLPLIVLASWRESYRINQYYGLLLLNQFGLLGVFAALDLFMFYVFWEIVLVPMYFLIAIWGGARSKYAAIKFFLYSFFSSLVMLLGFFVIYFASEMYTFDMLELAKATIPLGVQIPAFLAIFFGVGVKMPIVPFHTWLPDAHVEAPSPVSMLLAAVLLKLGTYGFVRLNQTLLTEAAVELAWLTGLVAIVMIVYCSLVAMAQEDLKSVIAYASIPSMGIFLLGVSTMNEIGMKGGIFQMFNHGLYSGLLFFLVGVIYGRTHTRMIADMSGLMHRIPVVATMWFVGAFAALGLPGLAPFVSEITTLIGTWSSTVLPMPKAFVVLALFGIVVTAGYMLWVIQRVILGDYRVETEYHDSVVDAHWNEIVVGAILVIALVVFGVYPAPFFELVGEIPGRVLAGVI